MTIEDVTKRKLSTRKEATPTTVMIVEDQRSLRKALEVCLRAYGYKVIAADNGRVALELLMEGQTAPDLIISDIMMPEMNGFDLFQSVRRDSRWWDLPFIFLTAKGTDEDVRQGKLLGAEDYIIKPFDPEDLRVAVESKMRRARELQQHVHKDMESLKERLMALLSHEVNTPLTNIKLATDLLAAHRESLTPEKVQHLVDSIRHGQTRLTGLVNDILLVMAIDSGLARVEYDKGKRPFRLNISLQTAVEACRSRAEARNVTLEMSEVPNELFVRGLERQLSDAVARILSNAIKFSPEGGHVTIETQVVDSQVSIAIHDDGRGIPADQLPHVFERFYQADREEHEQQGGGLGLSIVEAYIDMHDGRVEVESGENSGSTFTVWLPRRE